MVDSDEDYKLRIAKSKMAFAALRPLFNHKTANLALKRRIFTAYASV
jgi:hypothetical protein